MSPERDTPPDPIRSAHQRESRERARQLRDRALKRLREGNVGKALASFAA